MMKTRWLHNLLHKASVIDDGALLFLTLIDIILTVVFFIACSIDILTMIGLIALGLLIPIIKVRSWIKLKPIPATIWAIITAFAGLSFMLSTISEQDTKPVTPIYVTESKAELKKLQDEQEGYRKANQRTNANSMQQSIDKQQNIVNESESKASKEISHVKALSVFGRIPEICHHPTAPLLIAMTFYLFIFGGFEWTIYTIATDMGKTKPVNENSQIQPKRTTKKRKRSAKKPSNSLQVSFVDNLDTVEQFEDEPVNTAIEPFSAYQFKQ